MAKSDKMHDVAACMSAHLAKVKRVPFWGKDGRICLDYKLLAEALKVPIQSGEDVRTGRFAGAIDLWIAQEFGRAGFEGLWPRLEEPRALDPELLRATSQLPRRDARVGSRLMKEAGSSNANVLGSVYVKQVDVGLSSWLSGPELLISTKTMGGSFGKNLPNRFEEAYGDAKNLRARYPLAAHGFFFLVKSTILDERSAFEKAVHMLHQLALSQDVYDATCLLLVDWDEGSDVISVPSDKQALVPADLRAEAFFETLIEIMLREAPIDWHKKARSLRSLSQQGLGGAIVI